MSQYVTRVELHEATSKDYETLHKAMSNAGFARTIKGSDGTVYLLPTAEYYSDVSQTRNQVLENAKKAAASTGRRAGVLVVESNGCTWSGLEKV